MKIGFIYTKFYPVSSSASVHGYQVAKELKALGYEILTLGIGRNELTLDYSKKQVLKFIHDVDIFYIRINPWLWNDWFTLAKLLFLGRKKVIWEINAPVEEVLAYYSKQGLPTKIKRWITKQNFKRKLLARFCDASTSVSSVLQEYASKELKIKKSICIPNGCDPDLFIKTTIKESHPLYEIVQGKFVVVWAGNAAVKWQGIKTMLDVAAKINTFDKDVLFVFFSNVSVYNQKVHSNILSLGEINYKILPIFLSVADVALCIYEDYTWSPYGFYNSSLKQFDYMSMGLPTIASNMGQMSEVISDGVDGFLTDNSIDDIVRKIILLKGDQILREKMGRAARLKVEEDYSWKNNAKKLQALIESL